MRVIAYTKYDREAASTRYRILQYKAPLARAGIELTYRPLLGDSYVRGLVTGERPSRTEILRSYARRFREILRAPQCDLIWIYADLFPYVPGGFERLVYRRGIPVVYDWDDAFFLYYNESQNPFVRLLLKNKIERLISGAAAATCGNEFLRVHAAEFCPLSVLFPTVVDTDVYRPLGHAPHKEITIGWIGSPSNWPSVRTVLPVLRELCAGGNVRFRAVGAEFGAASDIFAGMELVPWLEETEVAEIQGFDIGIMPLVDAPFERGKSGFKLVQYMACGVPAVASPVGVNETILESSSGLLAGTPRQWKDALKRLIGDDELRKRMGAAARRRALANYSLHVHAPRLIELFRGIVQG